MKQYNGEKAIISLTSWKARISKVGLTIYSILKQCPGFHVVLVLSEEEFPNKEMDLPDTVLVFVEQNLLELLWIKHNYKTFKKILFTSKKYKDTPIISADDDCVYTCNYAEELYQGLRKHNCVVRYPKYYKSNHYVAGPYTIYPKYEEFGKWLEIEFFKKLKSVNLLGDDDFYNEVIRRYNLKYATLNKSDLPCIFHAQEHAIHKDLV